MTCGDSSIRSSDPAKRREKQGGGSSGSDELSSKRVKALMEQLEGPLEGKQYATISSISLKDDPNGRERFDRVVLRMIGPSRMSKWTLEVTFFEDMKESTIVHSGAWRPQSSLAK